MGTGESALHFWDPEFCNFENRAPIWAFVRAPARSKFDEILKKCSKIIKKSKKKSIFSKKNIFVNKRPWKFFKCFGHVFHSFVTCKVFWSDLILVTSVWKVSPKHAQNIWRTFRNVYSNFFVFWKNRFFFDFFMIFEHFLRISPSFERAGARANAPIGARFLKSQNSGSQKCNALSPMSISLF